MEVNIHRLFRNRSTFREEEPCLAENTVWKSSVLLREIRVMTEGSENW